MISNDFKSGFAVWFCSAKMDFDFKHDSNVFSLGITLHGLLVRALNIFQNQFTV